MASILLTSPTQLSGKTTVAAGLAKALQGQVRNIGLVRLAGDAHASQDASLFANLPFNTQKLNAPVQAATASSLSKETGLLLVEAPAGAVQTGKEWTPDHVVVIARPEDMEALPEYCQGFGERLAGVFLNRTPKRQAAEIRAALEARQIPLLAAIPEDRILAAPSLGQVAQAIGAEGEILNGQRHHLVRRAVIAPISVDPGQRYFTNLQPDLVVVRGDRPDLHLGALQYGKAGLVLTGGFTPIGYVKELAESNEVPLLLTELDTTDSAIQIEELYGSGPFLGEEEKLHRLDELLVSADLSALTARR